MTDAKARDRLLEQALAHKGMLPLADLLAALVPVAKLRELARAHGLSPKGFRVETAKAEALAAALVRDGHPELIEQACALLWEEARTPAARPTEPAAPAAPPPPDLSDELTRTQQRLAQAIERQTRADARAAELESRLAAEQQRSALLRGQLSAVESRPTTAGEAAHDRDLARELHDARTELEAFAQAEQDYRRRFAELQAQIKAQASRLEELEDLVPQGRRRKRLPPEPPAVERYRVPYFTPDFYRSLEGRDRRSIEAVFDAVFRFAVAGHAYPGLEVKQLEGVDLWSMRAGIKLRVYFRPRADGDIDVLAAGDREDQHTLLRRLR